MPKEEWGVKRICPTTGRRFYDLKRVPIVSPYTGETVTLDDNTRTRVAIAAKAEVADDEIELDDDAVLLDDDNAEADMDDELLEDDEDDNVSLDDIADVAAGEDE